MLLQETETVPVQPYPTTTQTNQHPTRRKYTMSERIRGCLHCDDSVIDDSFFGEEVCADDCFVFGAELFVYLSCECGEGIRGLTY